MTDPPTSVRERPAGTTGDASRPLATGRRLRSLDVARGLVVASSVLVTNLPGLEHGFWLAHAEWYGFAFHDLYLPMFLFLFGSGIAIAYRRGVDRRRLARRTVLLVVYGLVFNGIVGWDLSPARWRLTSVLGLFAVTGLIVTLATRVARRWWQALLLAVLVLGVHQAVLLGVADRCGVPLPMPGCNPSGVVDPAVFGAQHLYRGGAAGYDPEGIGMWAGATATVLVGYAAGSLLWHRRAAGAAPALLALSVGLLATAPLASVLTPISKKLWSPSFAVLCAGAGALLLAVLHVVVDRRTREAGRPVALLEAYGRNSLLVYFGKFVVTAVLVNLRWPGRQDPIRTVVLDALGAPAVAASWVYVAVLLLLWSVVVTVLHRRGWYLKA